jgi:hypothetical protein
VGALRFQSTYWIRFSELYIMADSDEVKTTQSWATAATIISAITLAIILFGGIIYLGSVKGWFDFSKWSWPKFGEWGILKSLSAGGVSLGTIMAAVVLFIPDTAVLGGFIADAVNAQFRYSIPSITGLLAAILNYLSTFLFGRDATETQYILGNPRPPPTAAGAAGVVTQAAAAVTSAAAGAADGGCPHGTGTKFFRVDRDGNTITFNIIFLKKSLVIVR